MKEARIVMPCASHLDGWSDVHSAMTNELVKGFGGLTKAVEQGSWVGADGKVVTKTVIVYDVAMTDTDANVDHLCRIAEHYGRKLEQHSIYVRYPDGRVFITELK